MFRPIFLLALSLLTTIGHSETFEISITNTSNREGFGGQNISGPALLIHDQQFQLFQQGQPSSQALWEIAEEGDTSAAIALAGSHPNVVSSHRLNRIPRGQTGPSTNRFEVERPSGLRFSLAGMLTSSNDGFAGLTGERLPSRIGERVRYDLRAWDSGSEENNEMCPFVPCADHYIRKVEGSEGQVLPHPGIKGIGDLDRIDRGWPANNIVGFVEVTRIN